MSETMSEYQRGFEAGRHAGDLLIHRKARKAYDTLCAAGLADEAGAMWAEISRLQGIVCSACEASMEAGRDREAATEKAALNLNEYLHEAAEHDRTRARLSALRSRCEGLEAALHDTARYLDPRHYASQIARIAELLSAGDVRGLGGEA